MTTTAGTSESVATAMAQARLPSVWRVGLSRGQVELKAFFRERQSVVFIFAMPAVMLVLLGAIDAVPDDVPLAGPARRMIPHQAPGAPQPDRRHAWETGNLRWHVFYLVVFAAVLAIVLVSTPGSTVVAGGAVAALIPWYLLVGRPPAASTAATAFGIAAAGGGFSVFYGAWVTRIIEQSAERAAIIDQLEATRAELAAAQHKAGRLAERQRLAADIHDTLAQGFTSILMLLQAAQAELGGAHSRAGRHLDLAAQTARESLGEARALVADLAPAQLDGGTLPDALRRLSQAPGVSASFGLSGAPRPLPVATEVVLLRVCQEALANVRKHACARSATVRLGYAQDAVRLEISDDGAGFDPDRVSGGYGLRGMRTRIAEAGGTLTVRSSPGTGTRVSAQVPA